MSLGVRSRAAEIRRLVYSRRPLPFCEVAYTRTIDVSAKPNSGENALPAIRRALAEAQAGGQPTRVRLAPGRYELYPDFIGTGYCFRLDGTHDLLLDGSQAELVIHNPLAGLLRLDNCRRVLVRDLEVDYDPLPFTQGTVQDVHPADVFFDLLLDAGYSAFDEPHWGLLEHNINWLDTTCWGMLKDRSVRGRLKAGADSAFFATSFERLGERLFRLKLVPPAAIRCFEPGDRYVHLSRPSTLDGSFVYLGECEGVTFMNMLSYASPSYCYAGVGSSWLGFINCAVRLKEGRWHTLDSDGIDLMGGRIGPWIENCFFEAGADDTFVTMPPCPYYGADGNQAIGRTADDRQLSMTNISPLSLRPGDPLLFYNPRDGLPLGKAVVDTVDYAAGTVRFAERLPPLLLDGAPALRDTAINLANLNANLVIRGCTVRNNRRWPVWLYTPAMDGGIIEHNTFVGNDMSAIRMFTDVGWDMTREAIRDYAARPVSTLPADIQLDYGLGHILIADNVMEDNGFNTRQATIQIDHPCLGYRPSSWPMLNDIVITDNRITNWYGDYAMSLSNTRRALVAGNRIGQTAAGRSSLPLGYFHSAYSEEGQFTDNTQDEPLDIPTFTEGLSSSNSTLRDVAKG
ncbi:MAG: right-handed parallel beta-helix repeat-containing protein [Anaerolineae bacterium]